MSNLPLLAQEFLNKPLCCSASHALLLSAVFAGKLNIAQVTDQARGLSLGRDEMRALQQNGKLEADANRAKHRRGYYGELIEGEYFKRSRCGRIAVIDVTGTLTRTWGAESYSGTTGYDGIKMAFDDAIEDKDIRAMWFAHNSPGGSTNGMFDLSNYIKAHGFEETGKLTVAYAGDYSYSASFALASACDRLYVPQTGGVGSVGVMAVVMSYAEALAKEGMDARVLRYPEEKALSHPFEPLNEPYLADLYAEIVEIGTIFQELVARNRGIPINAVAETSGRTYMGENAKAIGFVDDVLPEQVAWEWIENFVNQDGGATP